MNNRILIYIDGWFIQYGLATKLQNKINSELYAIIDVDNKTRKFYETQNLVSFKKTWFYKDSITKKIFNDPDIEYLKNFEEKYNINLWSISYTDRNFYKYNKLYHFSENEILSILEHECKFFESLLENCNPDYFITYMTLTHHHHLLYEMCKSKNIKPLMLGPVKFANRFMISSDGLQLDDLSIDQYTEKSREELLDYLNKYNSFQRIKKIKQKSFSDNKFIRYKSNLNFFLSTNQDNTSDRYSNFGKTKSKILKEKIIRSLNRKMRQSYIDKYFSRSLLNKKPYVFFPLHYEPERILLVTAPYYDNQLSVISNIAKSLPVGYRLLVKEHLMMSTLGWRSKSYYRQISDLPNVELIHPTVNPEEIIKNSSLVITIAGTAGQEAAFYGIPTILFSDQIYSIIPSVKRLTSMENLSSIIREQLKQKIPLKELNDFVNLIDKNSFTFEINDIGSEFAYTFGLKGQIMDCELPSDKIQKFLDKHDATFELLANEFLKKIHLDTNPNINNSEQ